MTPRPAPTPDDEFGSFLSDISAALEAVVDAGETTTDVDRWYFDRERIDWGWLALDDRLIEEGG